jgi:hypothetical protein
MLSSPSRAFGCSPGKVRSKSTDNDAYQGRQLLKQSMHL